MSEKRRDIELGCVQCEGMEFEAIVGFKVAAAGGMQNPLLYHRCITCKTRADSGQMLLTHKLRQQEMELEQLRKQKEEALEGLNTTAEAYAIRGEKPPEDLPPVPTAETFDFSENETPTE